LNPWLAVILDENLWRELFRVSGEPKIAEPERGQFGDAPEDRSLKNSAPIMIRTAKQALKTWNAGKSVDSRTLQDLEWQAGSPKDLATSAAFWRDPSDMAANGATIGLAALPFIMRAKTSAIHSRIEEREQNVLPSRQAMCAASKTSRNVAR
jgi:hypothetical protein